MTPHIILVGLPGVGKTTTGRHVAKELGRQFTDFDDEIVKMFGKSVSKIFTEDGEQSFRKAEAEVSRQWAEREGGIIAPGGGWIMNQSAVAHLRPASRIIYLRVSPAEALRRMGQGITRRPLFSVGDPQGIMRALYEARRQYYEEADVTVETDGLSWTELAAAVVDTASALVRKQ